ncbi:MAG: hypothetical protein ACKOXO_04070 [Cyanobium sp.]
MLRVGLSTLVLSGLVAASAVLPVQSGPRFGGGVHAWGGGVYHFDAGSWQRGYHPLYGGGVRPAWRDGGVGGVKFYDRGFYGWNAGWRRGGYWASRPWRTGWYAGWGGWNWWAGSAVTWGLTGLATGATIAALVNASADASSPLILVPSTSYELNYGSVEAVGDSGVSFSYNVNGHSLIGAANCMQGLLNGQIPGTADQAQLLNAVCQVAYGPGA